MPAKVGHAPELPADEAAQATYPRWTHRDISGWGEKPALVDSESGTAVVLGNAMCVWDDIRKLPAHDAVIAINDVGAYYRHKVHHWISYHDQCLIPFREVRRSKHRNDPMLHAHFLENVNAEEIYDIHYWNLTYHYSTSGILAVLIGLLLGYDKLILAGMPADNTPDFWQDPNVWNSQGTKVRHKLWQIVMDRVPDIQRCCRSVSGHTMQWLGAPDAEWLKK
jgi:hypothetical protein